MQFKYREEYHDRLLQLILQCNVNIQKTGIFKRNWSM